MEVYFINLASRPDRLEHIQTQVDACPWPVKRIEAVHHPLGSLGCARSHVMALREFLSGKANVCLVLEDDFTWHKVSQSEGWDKVRVLLDQRRFPWDMALLCYFSHRNRIQFIDEKSLSKLVARTHEAQTTAGYMVKREYAPVLLQCFEKACTLLEKYECPKKYAIDVCWKELQSNGVWLVFHPRLGVQKPGYSDIEQRDVDYKC